MKKTQSPEYKIEIDKDMMRAEYEKAKARFSN
jgi:hypothetical protein